MLLFNRRHMLLLALGAGVSGCGFEPVYKQGTSASDLQGQIEIDLVKGRNGFELREELENKLGRAGSSAPYVLTFKLTTSQTGLAVTEDTGTKIQHDFVIPHATWTRFRVMPSPSLLSVSLGSVRDPALIWRLYK